MKLNLMNTERIADQPSKKNIPYLFIAESVLFWFLLPLFLCFIAGIFTGYSTQWIQGTFLIVGYSCIGLGFFGSTLYCLIHF